MILKIAFTDVTVDEPEPKSGKNMWRLCDSFPQCLWSHVVQTSLNSHTAVIRPSLLFLCLQKQQTLWVPAGNSSLRLWFLLYSSISVVKAQIDVCAAAAATSPVLLLKASAFSQESPHCRGRGGCRWGGAPRNNKGFKPEKKGIMCESIKTVDHQGKERERRNDQAIGEEKNDVMTDLYANGFLHTSKLTFREDDYL